MKISFGWVVGLRGAYVRGLIWLLMRLRDEGVVYREAKFNNTLDDFFLVESRFILYKNLFELRIKFHGLHYFCIEY